MLRQLKTRYTIAVVLVIAAMCSALTSPSTSRIPPDLQGDWSGAPLGAAVKDTKEQLEWHEPARLRVVISDKSARVYAWSNGSWREIKPGTFSIKVFDTNAVISSITSGTDSDGVWVETWSFAFSVIDSRHLRGMFQRQVNNKDMKRDNPSAVWGTVASGVFERG